MKKVALFIHLEAEWDPGLKCPPPAPSCEENMPPLVGLSLLSSNEHIENVIKDPGPSQEHPRPLKLQQSVIILQEGS